MFSRNSLMDYQKPVKVKSRWTQSSQMEMMMEESQSSLDNMSDAITDVSTSDLNESIDYNSELNSVDLKISRRIISNKIDFRQLNGLITAQQHNSPSSIILNKIIRKKKQQLNSLNVKNKNNISHTSIDMNKITISLSKRKSKSVNNINDYIIENIPQKPIRRASLSWKFTYAPINKMEYEKSNQQKDIYYNISGTVKNSNQTVLEIKSSSTKNNILCMNDKFICKENPTYNNTFQKSYSDRDALNLEDVHELINNKFNNIELNKQKKPDMLNISMDQSKEENPYQISSIYKSRRIRSKSLDSLMIKSNNNIKRCKSYNDINKLDTVVDAFKMKQLKKNPTKKKRRQSKRIKPKNNYIEILDDMKVPVVNYDQEADQIFREHKNQLMEARMNDKDFDEKLKSTNFTLINENIYRPNR